MAAEKKAPRSLLVTLLIFLLFGAWQLHLSPETFTRTIPGPPLDNLVFLWNLWWLDYSITELHQNPYQCDYIFYPQGVNLAFHTFSPALGLLAMPCQRLLGLPAAFNLLVLLAAVLSGFGIYLMVHEHSASRFAGWLAGIAFVLSPYRTTRLAEGHLNLLSTQWLVLVLLFAGRMRRRRGAGNACWLAFVLALQVWSDDYYLIFAFLLLAVDSLAALIGMGSSTAPGYPGRWLLMLTIFTTLWWPRFLPAFPYWLPGRTMETSGAGPWLGAETLSADPALLLTPSPRSRLLAAGVGSRYRAYGSQVLNGVISPGLAVLLLAAVALLSKASRRTACYSWLLAILSFILALGPRLLWQGEAVRLLHPPIWIDGLEIPLPLPFLLFHKLPVLQALRAPVRFIVVTHLALALAAGLGAAVLITHLRSRALRTLLAGALAAGLLLELAPLAPPRTKPQIPALYAAVTADPDDVAVLEIPIGWRDSFAYHGLEDSRFQAWQAVHHKRLLNGHASRLPGELLPKLKTVPLLRQIAVLQTGAQVISPPYDRDDAVRWLRDHHFRYIVIHDPFTRRPVHAFLRDQLPLQRVAATPAGIVYRLSWQGLESEAEPRN